MCSVAILEAFQVQEFGILGLCSQKISNTHTHKKQGPMTNDYGHSKEPSGPIKCVYFLTY